MNTQKATWQSVSASIDGVAMLKSEFQAVLFVPEHKHRREDMPQLIQDMDILLSALTGMPLITDTTVPAKTILFTRCGDDGCEGKCREYELYGDLRKEFEAVFHKGRDACIELAEKLKEGQIETVQAYEERKAHAHLHA